MIELGERKLNGVLSRVEGMGRVAELDEFELVDDTRVVERDGKRIALLERLGRACDDRPIGAQAAVWVQEIAGRVDFGIEVDERAGAPPPTESTRASGRRSVFE